MYSKNSSLDYFCIFGGGGIRGTAYIGAIKALQEIGIQPTGYAGSSVGALFATFYALGCTIEEMESFVYDLSYETFHDFYFNFTKDFGLSRGEKFLETIRGIIEEKFYEKSYKYYKAKPVKFKDFKKDLIIITTDITNGCFKEFSRYTTPDVEIAQAIRASASLPGLFKPFNYKKNLIVDGDLIKCTPAWSLSDNINLQNNRILEFRLEGSKENAKINNTIEYLQAVFNTVSNVATDFVIDLYAQNDKYDYVKIETGDVFPVDFGISKSKKRELIDLGEVATRYYFENTLRKKKKFLLNIYESIIKYIENINIHKAKKTRLVLAELCLYINENKSIIKVEIYDSIMSLKSLFMNNLHPNVFGQDVLKNKKEIINNIDLLLNLIEWEIREIKNFDEAFNSKNSVKEVI